MIEPRCAPFVLQNSGALSAAIFSGTLAAYARRANAAACGGFSIQSWAVRTDRACADQSTVLPLLKRPQDFSTRLAVERDAMLYAGRAQIATTALRRCAARAERFA